jgi:hypothetical protein
MDESHPPRRGVAARFTRDPKRRVTLYESNRSPPVPEQLRHQCCVVAEPADDGDGLKLRSGAVAHGTG